MASPLQDVACTQLTLDGEVPFTAIEEIPQRVVENGEVFRFPRGLQRAGCFDALVQRTFAAISTLGRRKADAIRTAGIENTHKVISVEELTELSPWLFRHINPAGPSMLVRIGKHLMNLPDPYYVEHQPNARLMVPYDLELTNARLLKEFTERNGPGKITIHGPHHDSWFEHPLNVINVWAAIGPVVRGNGMGVYPEVWGKRLPYDETGNIDRRQVYGRPINFNLDPGDVVLFAGEHLHSSELNISHLTRFVVSARLTIDKPNYFGSRELYDYSRSDEVDDILDQPVSNPTWLDRLRERRRRARMRAQQADGQYPGAPGSREIPHLDDTSEAFPADLEDETGTADLSTVSEGAIAPLNRRYCVTRLDGELYRFQRRCPHQGADLAAAHIEDGAVVCPWHNVPFSLRDGSTTCDGLSIPAAERIAVEDVTAAD